MEVSKDVENLQMWWKVCDSNELTEGNRIHVEIDGRFVTVFRNKGELCCIDSGELTKCCI